MPSLALQSCVAFASIASNTGCKIARRGVDDLEDFRGRGLLLEGVAQLAGPRLHLLEQAHVLDRDHGLIGEGRSPTRSASRRTAIRLELGNGDDADWHPRRGTAARPEHRAKITSLREVMRCIPDQRGRPARVSRARLQDRAPASCDRPARAGYIRMKAFEGFAAASYGWPRLRSLPS